MHAASPPTSAVGNHGWETAGVLVTKSRFGEKKPLAVALHRHYSGGRYLQLHYQGRLWLCYCGRFFLWVGEARSFDASQHERERAAQDQADTRRSGDREGRAEQDRGEVARISWPPRPHRVLPVEDGQPKQACRCNPRTMTITPPDARAKPGPPSPLLAGPRSAPPPARRTRSRTRPRRERR
jgi:hypothetical protein